MESINKKHKEEIKTIINGMLDDDEFWVKGIPEIDNYLQEVHGLTEKQAGSIVYRLAELVNGICHKIS